MVRFIDENDSIPTGERGDGFPRVAGLVAFERRRRAGLESVLSRALHLIEIGDRLGVIADVRQLRPDVLQEVVLPLRGGEVTRFLFLKFTQAREVVPPESRGDLERVRKLRGFPTRGFLLGENRQRATKQRR